MQCRVCDQENLELVLDLGNHPWCNDFITVDQIGKEPHYPLRLMYCHDCCTSQLDYTVKKEIMFGDHTYLSGMTKTLSDHFKNIAQETYMQFLKGKEKKLVVDIGSNDGTQLKHFQDLGCDIIGIESSCTTADIANQNGIRTRNVFFNEEVAEELLNENLGPCDLMNASGVFFHLEELHSVCRGIKKLLAEDGVFVVQFLYMKNIIENLAFDQIYHEHLLYYTLKTINHLLARHDLQMFDARVEPIHGGSVIAYVGHPDKFLKTDRLDALIQAEEKAQTNHLATYISFADRVKKMKEENLDFLRSAKAKGKKVFGMGAPVKGNTLLNYFGVGRDYIECLLEINPLRANLYSPGQHIPIIMEKDCGELPDIYYVLAWNFKEEILKKNKDLIEKGVEFYFPVNAQT